MRSRKEDNVATPISAGVYEPVVERARAATGVDLVIATSIDHRTGRIRTEATSGYGTGRARRALQAVRRLYPSFDPLGVELDVHVNPVQEAVFLRGESVTAHFVQVSTGVVPDVVLRIASKFLGLRFSTVVPLIVADRVIGSLSFHGTRAPSEALLISYQAFAGQASLVLENAALLRAMHDQVEELREARRLVSAGNEAVRRDIAETLHGTVQTQLLVADLNLRKALALVERGPKQAKAIIEEERARIAVVRERDIREVSHLLHPSVIKLGLGPAIRSLADRFRSVMDVELEIDASLDGIGGRSEHDVGPDLRLTVYRLVEEALANAHKHGEATRVRAAVKLSEAGDLRITVVDNGTGLDEGTVKPGLGLTMVAMHVDEAGGDWSVTPGVEDVGVTFSAVIPTGTPVAGGPSLVAFQPPAQQRTVLMGSR